MMAKAAKGQHPQRQARPIRKRTTGDPAMAGSGGRMGFIVFNGDGWWQNLFLPGQDHIDDQSLWNDSKLIYQVW